MIKKALIILLLVILVIFLVIITGSYFLLGTDRGFKWTAKKLESSVTGLSIGDTTGNLERGINTPSVSWERDGVAVDVQNLTSTWSSGCLLTYTYCLDTLNVDLLRIKTRPSTTSSKKNKGTIELPNIVLPLDVDANKITIGKLILDTAENSPPIILDNVQLKARAGGSDVNIEWLKANYKNYSVNINGSATLQDDYPMQGTVNATAHRVVEDKSITTNLTFSESLRNIVVRGYVTGVAEATIVGTIQPLEPKLPLQLQVNWDSNGWPIESLETISSRDAQLDLEGTLDDYRLKLSTTIEGEQVPTTQVNINGLVNPERALFPTVNLFLLDGFATGSAAVTWKDNVTWVADVIAKKINPEIKWPGMFGDLNGLVKAHGFSADGNWTLNVNTGKVDGSLRNFPFTLDTKISKNTQNLWRVNDLKLNNGPNSLVLDGTYGTKLDINSSMDFPAIHYLIPTIAGNLTADAKITGSLTQPTADIKAKSSLLTTAGVLIRGMDLDAKVLQGGDKESTLSLSVDNLTSNAQEYTNLDIGLDGTKTNHSIAATVNSPYDSRVQLTAGGSLTDKLDWKGQLKSALINFPGHDITLDAPTNLNWRHATTKFSIDPNCWIQNTAKLCLNNQIIASQTGHANITLDGYALETLNALLPANTQFQGNLDTAIDFSWGENNQAFTANINANVDNGIITVKDADRRQHQFKYKSLKLTTNADPYTITSELVLTSDSVGNGHVGLTLNPKNENKNIVGDISLKGFDVAFIKAFLPNLDEVAGIVNIEGDIAGSLVAPEFIGQINLEDPVIRSSDLPLSIDGGSISMDLSGSSATVNGLLKSEEGNLRLGGKIGWPRNKLNADLTVDGNDLVIVQNPVVHSVVNPALTIKYNNDKLTIGGRVQIPSADINIKELPEGTTTLSSDVIVIEDEIKDQDTAQTGNLKIQVDVDVELGEDINLSGYGLESRLTGNFNVKKKGADPPQLIGEITVIEGFYQSYGQDLEIKDGQILFVGPISRTTLNIDAIRVITAEERIAGLRLTGPIADPKTTLFTEPADKTQESILSYIVLGRDLGGGTSDSESSLLATAALALTIKEGKGYATGFAESLGISDFTVEADGSGDDTQVVLSGRLSSKLLLRYGRSVFVPEQTLFLRYDLSRRLYLEAAQGMERAVDLFYSFSF